MASKEFERFKKMRPSFRPLDGQGTVDYAKSRELMDEMASSLHPAPTDVECKRVRIHGIDAEWVIPKDSPKDKAVLYLHGGGFSVGSIVSSRHFAAAFARESGINTIVLEYRLAPENPYPAGLEDCLSAYRGLPEQGIPSKGIIVAGDSAGGNLSLATVLYLKDRGEALPAAVVAIAPVTDFKATGASYKARAEFDPMAGGISKIIKAYVPDQDLEDPYISPLYGDYRNFPPLFLQVGTDDVLLDDAKMLAEKARAAGVEVTLRVWEEMRHVFVMDVGEYPEAGEGVREIGDYIKACFSSQK
jgi:acetyl esterase/lipase